MGRKKKIIIGSIVTAVVLLLCAGGLFLAKKMNAVTVSVISAGDLMQNFYMGPNSMNGTITNSVTQDVQLEKDAIIEQVYVSKGDKVNIGDKLITYDMTLKEMELEIQRLTKQQYEQQLAKARERLADLQAGGKVTKDDMNAGGGSTELNTPSSPDSPEGAEELAYHDSDFPMGTQLLATAMRIPRYLSTKAKTGIIEEETGTGETEKDDTEEGSGVIEDLSPTTTPDPDGDNADLDTTPDGEGFYRALGFKAQAYAGTGTKEDPLRFLCSSADGGVIVTGAFLNKMAGYVDEDGSKKGEEGPFYYRLEFHRDNRLTDPEKPEESLIGYYYKDGSTQKEPAKADDQSVFSLEGAKQPDVDGGVDLTPAPSPTETPDEDPGGDDLGGDYPGEEGDIPEDGGDDPGITMTREEAIKAQKSAIKSLQLSIRTIALKISRLEKTLENKTVVASIKGVVKTVGDPATGTSDGDAFIQVESEDGLYVKGELSESKLGTIQVGQMLTGMVYETGTTFDATIRQISNFPSDSQNYDGTGNPNVSYYPFIAQISNQTNLKNQDMVQLTFVDDGTSSQNLSIIAAFVRSEDGQYYVLKDDKGKLKKQIVKVGSSDGYTTEIKSGVDLDDKLAFPYGKGVEEGAKTKDGTLEDLYGVM